MRLRTAQFGVFALIVALLFITVGRSQAQSGADVAVHFVEGTPQVEQFNYTVSVYFSAYRPGGNPVQDLQIEDVSITEDGRPVSLTSLETTENDPIHIVLVMDTSGSMRGAKMYAARQAAGQFVSRLGANDLAALLSFDTTVKTQIGFTDALGDVREKIDLLDATSGAGTCLYDALHEAVTLSATIPTGRRGIVVLTDGVDELPGGGRCSRYTEDDVIAIAKSGLTRVPIYTIGLGNNVDVNTLTALAERTGGRYQFAAGEQNLAELFQTLLEQLRSQYRAVYTSTAAPGPHQVVVEVTIAGQRVRELREFVLPPFPYVLRFVSPQSGDTVKEAITLQVEIQGQGEPIREVAFFDGETMLGVDSQPPYQYDWQPETNLNEEKTLSAVIFGLNGQELARNSVTVTVDTILLPTETPEAAPPPDTIEPPSQPQSISWLTLLLPIGLIGTAMVLVIGGVLLIAAGQKRKRKQQEEERREREWREKVILGGPVATSSGDEATIDGLSAADFAGTLVVLQSDNAAMVNQRFEIKKATTVLGRKSDSDIVFPQDKPVSRHHAQIENLNGSLYLSEIISLEADGSRKRPVYGTFINDQQIEGAVRLKDGDLIRLGKRVVLRFEAARPASDEDRTIDQIESGTLDELARRERL